MNLSLSELKDRSQHGTKELPALHKQTRTLRTSIANAGREADEDPEATAALTAARVQQLRELESVALAKIAAHRELERETRAELAGGLGVNLTPSERAAAAQLAAIYPDAATLPPTELRTHLQAAVLHEDRPAMFFWALASRTNMVAARPSSIGDTRDHGRDPEASAARSALSRLLPEIDEWLRDRSADPVLEVADELRNVASDLQDRIMRARANRGEGPPFGGPIKTVPVLGRETYDPSGYAVVGSS